MSDVTPPAEDDEDRTLIDRMRGTGVGVEDETIVGDVGPTDVAPGQDPDGGGLLVEGDDPGEV
ncbi:MAG TPA: hypothetical protein VFU19_15985 [Iamia sp.]|nr:hypothetical protein [Iamia sp.]